MSRSDAVLDAIYKALERWDEAERQARTLRQITKADVRRQDRLPDGSRIPTPRRSALARHLTAAALTAIREYDDEVSVDYERQDPFWKGYIRDGASEVSAELRAHIIRAVAKIIEGIDNPNTTPGDYWDRRIEPVFQVVQPILDERDAAIRRAEEAEQRAFEAEEALWDAGGDVTRDALIRALHEVSPDSHKRRNCRERHDIRADAILTAMGLDPHGKFRTRYAALRSQEDAGVPQEER